MRDEVLTDESLASIEHVGYLLANSALRAFPAALASHAIMERRDPAPDCTFSARLPVGGDSDGRSGEECEDRNLRRRGVKGEGRLESLQGYYVNSLNYLNITCSDHSSLLRGETAPLAASNIWLRMLKDREGRLS